MRLRDIMTTRPLTAGPGDAPDDVARLMELAHVHHLPLLDGDRLVGLWVATDAGPVVLLGPESVVAADVDDDPTEAILALFGGAEAAVVSDAAGTAGIVTRADVLELTRAGLAAAAVPATGPPLVIRLVGPAGAGKSTLIMCTIPMLRRCDAAVVQANPGGAPLPAAGVPVIRDEHAHWRKGLRACIERLGGTQVVLVEDRDAPAELAAGLGEDAQVLVVPAERVGELADASLRQAQALVVTHLDGAGAGLDAALEAIADAHPALRVFRVGGPGDDAGLDAWRAWLDGLISRRHM